MGFLQAGMPLLPDAAIDDGMLDVVLLHPRRFLSWVPLAFRVLAKRRRTDETIQRMTGRDRVSGPPRRPRASSTATRSGPGTSCGCSACTDGCWCGSPADPPAGPRAPAG